MQIDDNLILYLEDLSNLALSDDEKRQFTEDLQKILNCIDRLGKLNTDGIPECTHPRDYDNSNVLRDDEVHPSFDRELILKNAPLKNDEYFIAPKTVEQ